MAAAPTSPSVGDQLAALRRSVLAPPQGSPSVSPAAVPLPPAAAPPAAMFAPYPPSSAPGMPAKSPLQKYGKWIALVVVAGVVVFLFMRHKKQQALKAKAPPALLGNAAAAHAAPNAAPNASQSCGRPAARAAEQDANFTVLS